ncbi:TPA: hypothetical protein N0F65_002989 [Lagenidium giganteum]|uniref:EGF-like domain-containing protein n=1 Tax=Lagenidium giganteum TaxID=4803 RepID=A0AAV2YQL6_9STRA|nr:TPA: hypothetical protein N0F65_002989 [Lagenidium giganteum]
MDGQEAFTMCWQNRFLSAVAVCVAVHPMAADAFDSDFACCGGCSSSVRSRVDELGSQAVVFSWQPNSTNYVAPECAHGFPAIAARGGSEGQGRVRSGPDADTITHDADDLCCDNGGFCASVATDSGGTCRCVDGFTGDRCEFSVFDVARANNTQIYLTTAWNGTNSTFVPPYRQRFDYKAAIDNIAGNGASPPVAYTDIVSAVYMPSKWLSIVLGVIIGAIWTWTCPCRRMKPLDMDRDVSFPALYAFGIASILCIIVAFYFYIQTTSPQLDDHRYVREVLDWNSTLFRNSVALLGRNAIHHHLVIGLMENAGTLLAPHTFLDNLTAITTESVSQPVFEALEQLAPYSMEFPLAATTNCTYFMALQDIEARSAVMLATGCFQCPACADVAQQLARARHWWQHNTVTKQYELATAKRQLVALTSQQHFVSNVTKFIERMQNLANSFCNIVQSYSNDMKKMGNQFDDGTTVEMYVLIACIGLAAAVAALGAIFFPIVCSCVCCTDFVGFNDFTRSLLMLLLPAAPISYGYMYTAACMASDGLVVLQLLQSNISSFFADPAIVSLWRSLTRTIQTKQRLVNYTTSVGAIINSTRPLLEDLRLKPVAVESVENVFKPAADFIATSVRDLLLHDCGYNGNCAWLQRSINELRDHFEGIIENWQQFSVNFVIACIAQVILVILFTTLRKVAQLMRQSYRLHRNQVMAAVFERRRSDTESSSSSKQEVTRQEPSGATLGDQVPSRIQPALPEPCHE